MGDWPLNRSCFADRFRVNFERLTGQPEVYVDADLWTRFAEAILSPVRRHLQYSNFSAERRSTSRTAGTRTFARVDGRWKITRLLHTYQWITGNGALFDFSDPDCTMLAPPAPREIWIKPRM